MEDFRYYMPTEVYFGRECVLKHKELFAKLGTRAYIITYKIPGRHYSLEDVKAILEEASIPYTINDGIEENPSVETVQAGAKKGLEFGADFMIGIGGGSPIDAAKAIGVLMKNPNVPASDLFSNGSLESLPIIAIPTTAGTGAEVTHWSVLTRNDINTKQAISQRIFPRYALLDPQYLMGMPLRLTRATGIDALCHCIESYVSTAGNEYSRAICEIGFRYFSTIIENMAKDDYTYEVREKQMMISYIGGIANTQTGTCLPHGMSYALTHFKNIPHGLACGLLIKEYLAIFRNKTNINHIMNLCGFRNLNEFGAFIDSMLQLNIKVTPEEIEEYASEFASQKHRFARHPEPAGKAEILQIYTRSLIK